MNKNVSQSKDANVNERKNMNKSENISKDENKIKGIIEIMVKIGAKAKIQVKVKVKNIGKNKNENEDISKIMAIIESGEVCRCTPDIAKRSLMPPGTSQVHTFQDSLPQTCFFVPQKLRFRREEHGVPSHLHTIQRAAHLN